jgi:predicted component of type VI protein secretion system
MSDVSELAARLAETFSAEQRQLLIAALSAAQPAQIGNGMPCASVVPVGVPVMQPTPPPAPGVPLYRTTTGHAPLEAARGEAGLQAGPPVTDGTPNEAEDSPEERARLLAVLAAHPSGLSGYTLLDTYRVPPSTIELAMRDGQVARAERGLGLTARYGGAW